jgi:hypothetical protein
MNKLQKISVGVTTAVTALSTLALKAFAVADPDVATSVTTAATGMKENLVSGLETALPFIVAVAGIFWAVRFVLKKIAGRAH